MTPAADPSFPIHARIDVAARAGIYLALGLAVTIGSLAIATLDATRSGEARAPTEQRLAVVGEAAFLAWGRGLIVARTTAIP